MKLSYNVSCDVTVILSSISAALISELTSMNGDANHVPDEDANKENVRRRNKSSERKPKPDLPLEKDYTDDQVDSVKRYSMNLQNRRDQ